MPKSTPTTAPSPKDKLPRAHLTASSQSKDTSYTHIHMHMGRHADFFEDMCRDKLPDDDIYVPPHHQPLNPEDEDDVVPDQHAAFGIQRATQKKRETAWKDLGLGELMRKGPGTAGQGGSGGATGGLGIGGGSTLGGNANGEARRLPR